jgi:DNA-binding FadR family transcriptional regulator
MPEHFQLLQTDTVTAARRADHKAIAARCKDARAEAAPKAAGRHVFGAHKRFATVAGGGFR